MYCERCGFIRHVYFTKKCKNCGIKLKVLPEGMKQKYNIFNDDWLELCSIQSSNVICSLNEEIRAGEEMISREKNFVINELVGNPLFSMEEYQKRIQKQREMNKELAEFHQEQTLKRQAKNIAQMQKESGKQDCIPKCPICGSTSISKITLTKRAVKTAVFGTLGAVDDAGKTWQCKNCGSKF